MTYLPEFQEKMDVAYAQINHFCSTFFAQTIFQFIFTFEPLVRKAGGLTILPKIKLSKNIFQGEGCYA